MFLCTGSLIHYLAGSQDSRLFGSLGSSFFSKLMFIMRSLSLIGFPILLGYYSKETVLGYIFYYDSCILVILGLVGGSLTVAYRLRLAYIGFSSFGSFFPSISFSDRRFFYYPILLLYLFCLFLGVFFFYNFLPVTFFSFFESSLWLVVVFCGYVIFELFGESFFFLNFFLDLGYLRYSSVVLFSSFLKKIRMRLENTWSELSGGKGVKNFL